MTADLQPVDALAQVVGVVDGPARQPQDLALELGQDGEIVGGNGVSVVSHGCCETIALFLNPRKPKGMIARLTCADEMGRWAKDNAMAKKAKPGRKKAGAGRKPKPKPFRLEEATIDELHQAIRSGWTTLVAVVQGYLARVRAYNGVASALVTTDGAAVPDSIGVVRG